MKKVESVILDERKTRKFLRLMCGLRYIPGQNPLHTINLMYIILVYILLFVVIVQGIVWAYITDDIVEKVESIHYTLCIIIIIVYISNDLYHDTKLSNAMELMKYAYNIFNEFSEENKQIHIKINSNVSKSNLVFCFLMISSCVGYLLFAPIRGIFAEQDLHPRKLPIPMYMPFNTSHNLSYTIGMIWEAMTLFFMCGVATSVHQSYRGIMGKLRGELKILNGSVERIQERAEKKMYIYDSLGCPMLNSTPMFKTLIFSCIREDIIHHQLIIQYYNLSKKYLGTILLLFIFMSSIIVAAVGFLITRPNTDTVDIIKFLAIVSAELFFVYQLCWEGERVAEESELFFNNIFYTPWYQCDKNFRISIDIMLCGTIKPIRLCTSLFNVEASLETYNSVITTAFQYFNLLRNIQNA